MGPQVDIEAIFSVIDGLQEYNIENIGELSIYASKTQGFSMGNTSLNLNLFTPLNMASK